MHVPTSRCSTDELHANDLDATAPRLSSERLGEAHDLVASSDSPIDAPDEAGDGTAMQVITGLIDRRQTELRLACQPLGARLYAEKPRYLARRMRAYLEAARSSVSVDPKLTHAPTLLAD